MADQGDQERLGGAADALTGQDPTRLQAPQQGLRGGSLRKRGWDALGRGGGCIPHQEFNSLPQGGEASRGTSKRREPPRRGQVSTFNKSGMDEEAAGPDPFVRIHPYPSAVQRPEHHTRRCEVMLQFWDFNPLPRAPGSHSPGQLPFGVPSIQ
jgi:hypothetical protein